MKNITIGLVTFFTLLPTIAGAAPSSTTKKEVAIPCYNGGFNFALASYDSRPSVNISNSIDRYSRVTDTDEQINVTADKKSFLSA